MIKKRTLTEPDAYSFHHVNLVKHIYFFVSLVLSALDLNHRSNTLTPAKRA
jgi:hypothetical protein